MTAQRSIWDLPELAAAVRELCASQEDRAADAWGRCEIGVMGRIPAPGYLRRWIPQHDILPIMDWAYICWLWDPKTDGVCSEHWWSVSDFDRTAATSILISFIRHFCIRQEEEMLRICQARGDAEPGWGRVPGRVADARFLTLCDAARKVGVWTPLTQVLLEVEG